jgi:hypothetical protein
VWTARSRYRPSALPLYARMRREGACGNELLLKQPTLKNQPMPGEQWTANLYLVPVIQSVQF